MYGIDQEGKHVEPLSISLAKNVTKLGNKSRAKVMSENRYGNEKKGLMGKREEREVGRKLNKKKSISAEVYGFVIWVGSFFMSVLLCLWSLLPDSVLVQMGITYYPNRQWALRIPAFFCFSYIVFFFWVTFTFYVNVKPLDSFLTFQNEEEKDSLPNEKFNQWYRKKRAHLYAKLQKENPNALQEVEEELQEKKRVVPLVPKIQDVPLTMINKYLFEYPNCGRKFDKESLTQKETKLVQRSIYVPLVVSKSYEKSPGDVLKEHSHLWDDTQDELDSADEEPNPRKKSKKSFHKRSISTTF